MLSTPIADAQRTNATTTHTGTTDTMTTTTAISPDAMRRRQQEQRRQPPQTPLLMLPTENPQHHHQHPTLQHHSNRGSGGSTTSSVHTDNSTTTHSSNSNSNTNRNYCPSVNSGNNNIASHHHNHSSNNRNSIRNNENTNRTNRNNSRNNGPNTNTQHNITQTNLHTIHTEPNPDTPGNVARSVLVHSHTRNANGAGRRQTLATGHTLALNTSALNTSEVCRYFARGMCRFGEMCRFAHVVGETVLADNLYNPTTSQRNAANKAATAAATTAAGDSSPPTVGAQRNPAQRSTAAAAAATAAINRSQLAASKSASSAAKSAGGGGGGDSNDDDADDEHDDDDNSSCNAAIVPTDPTSWVLAPVFVPKKQQPQLAEVTEGISYAQAVGTAGSTGTVTLVETHGGGGGGSGGADLVLGNTSALPMCPYRVDGEGRCRYGERCVYGHERGEMCDLCGRHALSSVNEAQRKQHREECMRQHELNMELSFAIARSKDKSCGVCFEVILEKTGGEQRFGILPNCNHIFCLSCIRKWRLANQFDKKIIRACPECRVSSDFVCPSAFWVDTKEEKAKLLSDYRVALEAKDCKYFKQGQGKCPFGNKCFYKHAMKNGQLVDVGLPPKPVRRQNQLGENDLLQQFLLWDFMEERDHQWLDDMMLYSGDDDTVDRHDDTTVGTIWSDFDWERVEMMLEMSREEMTASAAATAAAAAAQMSENSAV